MVYVGARRVIDADSHLMETTAVPRRPRRRRASVIGCRTSPAAGCGLDLDAGRALRRGAGRARRPRRRADPSRARSGTPPSAPSIPDERGQALDLLGFEHQVVYSSLCAPLFCIADADVRYGAYRAHNRAMAAFCAADARLLGVGHRRPRRPASGRWPSSTPRLRWGCGRCGSRPGPPAVGRPAIPTTTRSGPASPSTACRSCSTSAAGRCRSAPSGWTTVARRPSRCRAPR